MEGTLLHVVLANNRKAVPMASTRQLLWKRPLRSDAGPSYNLVAGKHQAIVRDPSSVSSLLASAPSELTIAYQALLLGEPVGTPGSQETSEGNQSSSPSPKILPPLSSIGERLQVLKRLQAQGLITEEEFEARSNSCLIDSNFNAYPFAFARGVQDEALMQAQQWQSSFSYSQTDPLSTKELASLLRALYFVVAANRNDVSGHDRFQRAGKFSWTL